LVPPQTEVYFYALEASKTSSARYSIETQRSLKAMRGAALQNRPAVLHMVRPLVRPFVVVAARVLGPGPMRLKMVKLAHNLSDSGVVVAPVGGFGGEELGPATQPTSRAA
jgi:hypothetical protein